MSVPEASQALKASIDVALLDVNFGGRMVHDLANELRVRGVPLIFITGCPAI